MKVDIPFPSLLEAISSLAMTEKRQLWELLEAELFSDEEDSPEDIAEIQAARNEYAAGDYITFDEYHLQRANKK
jgi:hypothetical protein